MEKALAVLRDLQHRFPEIQVGGSVGLWLHGIRLKRFGQKSCDLDLTSPKEIRISDKQHPCSFDDFDYSFEVNGVTVDLSINEEIQPPVKIELDGYVYNVTRLPYILHRKSNYALKGVLKHVTDIYEMCGLTCIEEPDSFDLPF